jgi:F-type H+-transporting ATPase subunit epsilon
MAEFPFEVHTPYRLFFSARVQGLTLTLTDGEIGIYASRSAFTAPVVTGFLRIKDRTGLWRTAFISEGILEVKNHKTVLMVDTAEWPEEIDAPRALAAKQKAEEILSLGMLKFEAANAQAALKRAEFRLKIAGLKEELRGKP